MVRIGSLSILFVVLWASVGECDPPQSGLVLRLDASDLDGDGEPDQLAEGTAVSAWADADSSGIVLEQSDPMLQPTVGRVGGATALLFDNDFMVDDDVTRFFGRGIPVMERGVVVIVYSRTGEGDGNLFQVSGEDATISTSTNPSQGVGFAVSSSTNSVHESTLTNDGNLHVSVAASDGSSWELLTDGVRLPPVVRKGVNSGEWFGDIAQPRFMSVGAFLDQGQSQEPCCSHSGLIAEILVYSGHLWVNDRRQLRTYIMTKYGIDVCPRDVPCESREECNDGVDNDCDGAADGDDSDCPAGCARVGPFLRGDCRGTGSDGLTDAIVLLNWAFRDGPEPPCLAACDVEANGQITITDALRFLRYRFLGSTNFPDPPFPDCVMSTVDTDIQIGCTTPTPSVRFCAR